MLPLPLAIAVYGYAVILGSLAAAIIVLLPLLNGEIAELARQTPSYLARAEDQWHILQAGYELRVLPGGLREALDGAVHQSVAAGEAYLTGDLLPRIGGWLTSVPWLMLVPILGFFLLKDARSLRDLALQILLSGRLRSRGVKVLGELNETMAAYIRAQLTACLLIGVVCTLGFVVIGIP